jgi:plasmid stability protein
MATLYVENVPDDLYEALRSQAKARQRSIAAEVLTLLQENIPTAQELEARQGLFRKIIQLRETEMNSGRVYPSSEEMIREDRER